MWIKVRQNSLPCVKMGTFNKVIGCSKQKFCVMMGVLDLLPINNSSFDIRKHDRAYFNPQKHTSILFALVSVAISVHYRSLSHVQ